MVLIAGCLERPERCHQATINDLQAHGQSSPNDGPVGVDVVSIIIAFDNDSHCASFCWFICTKRWMWCAVAIATKCRSRADRNALCKSCPVQTMISRQLALAAHAALDYGSTAKKN